MEEARPHSYPTIAYEEYARRLERLRGLMHEKKLNGLLVGTGMNLAYFSGYPSPSKSGSRPFFLILPVAGDPIFIVQSGRRAEALRFSWIRDVRDYGELSRVPVGMIRDGLGECGMLGGTLALELGFEQSLDVPYLEFLRLQEGLRGTTIVDASEILWRLRMIKSEAEQLCLQQACQILSEAYAAAFAEAHGGQTERCLARFLRAYFDQAGAGESFILITSGRGNYDLATKPPEDRRIQRGDLVWVDAGCTVCGYWSDFSRAAVVGRASSEQLRAQEAIHRLTWEAIGKVRPGAKVSDLARLCTAGIHKLTFPITSSISGLASRAGHGLGLNVTEAPHIAESDQTTLEPGMVITIEPGVATEYGTFHIEENILVTESGCEVLSKAPRTLWEIPPG